MVRVILQIQILKNQFTAIHFDIHLINIICFQIVTDSFLKKKEKLKKISRNNVELLLVYQFILLPF